VHARVALHRQAGVEQSSAGVARMRAGLRVNRRQVLAMYGARLERGATHGAHERPTRAMDGLVLRQMTLRTDSPPPVTIFLRGGRRDRRGRTWEHHARVRFGAEKFHTLITYCLTVIFFTS